MKGILWGVVIAIALVVLVIGGIVFYRRGTPDAPTKASSPAKLKRKDFPKDLPPLFTPESPEADATSRYSRAFDFYKQNEELLKKDPPAEDPEFNKLADQLVDMFIDAMKAGQVSKPFLDDRILLKPGEYGDDTMVRMPTIVMNRGAMYAELKQNDKAVQAARAIAALGLRAFQNSVRLHNRLWGLRMTSSAAAGIGLWSTPSEPDKFKAWDQAAQDLEKFFAGKQETINQLDPKSVADIIGFAERDDDLTFRVEATLWLGVIKFRPARAGDSMSRWRGNARIITKALADLKNGREKIVADAAAAADKFTKADRKKMR
jgi:hypothetical protein